MAFSKVQAQEPSKGMFANAGLGIGGEASMSTLSPSSVSFFARNWAMGSPLSLAVVYNHVLSLADEL